MSSKVQPEISPTSKWEPLSRVRTASSEFMVSTDDCSSIPSSPSPIQQSETSEQPSLEGSPRFSVPAPPAIKESLAFNLVKNACDSIGDLLISCVIPCCASPCKTRFDALSEPKITLPCYAERIRHYSQATPEAFVGGVSILRRACSDGEIPLTMLNIHRLLVTAVMVYAKFYDDEIDSNSRWARIAGIKVSELNNLEVEFLNMCQFDLRVPTEAFQSLVTELMDFQIRPRATREEPVPSSEDDSASTTSSRRPHLWSFHVKRNSVASVSESESSVRSSRKSDKSHKGIMSFFHSTQHCHLNFNRESCSPNSMYLNSPSASQPSSPTNSAVSPQWSTCSVSSPQTPSENRTPSSRRRLPRNISGMFMSSPFSRHSSKASDF